MFEKLQDQDINSKQTKNKQFVNTSAARQHAKQNPSELTFEDMFRKNYKMKSKKQKSKSKDYERPTLVDYREIAIKNTYTTEHRMLLYQQMFGQNRTGNMKNLDTVAGYRKFLAKEYYLKYRVEKIEDQLSRDYQIKRRNSHGYGIPLSSKLTSNGSVNIYVGEIPERLFFDNCKLCKKLRRQSFLTKNLTADQSQMDTSKQLNSDAQEENEENEEEQSYDKNDQPKTDENVNENNYDTQSKKSSKSQNYDSPSKKSSKSQNYDSPSKKSSKSLSKISFKNKTFHELLKNYGEFSIQVEHMLEQKLTMKDADFNKIKQKFFEYLKLLKIFCDLNDIYQFEMNKIQNKGFNDQLMVMQKEMRQAEQLFRNIFFNVVNKYRYDHLYYNLVDNELLYCRLYLGFIDYYKLSQNKYKTNQIKLNQVKNWTGIIDLNQRQYCILEKKYKGMFKKPKPRQKQFDIKNVDQYNFNEIMEENQRNERFNQFKLHVHNAGHNVMSVNKQNPTNGLKHVVLKRCKSNEEITKQSKPNKTKHDCLKGMVDQMSVNINSQNPTNSKFNSVIGSFTSVISSKTTDYRSILYQNDLNKKDMRNYVSSIGSEQNIDSLKEKIPVKKVDKKLGFVKRQNKFMNSNTNLNNIFRNNQFNK